MYALLVLLIELMDWWGLLKLEKETAHSADVLCVLVILWVEVT